MGVPNKPEICVYTGLNFPAFPAGYAPEMIHYFVSGIRQGSVWTTFYGEPWEGEGWLTWASSTAYTGSFLTGAAQWKSNSAGDSFSVTFGKPGTGTMLQSDYFTEPQIAYPSVYDYSGHVYCDGIMELEINQQCFTGARNSEVGDLLVVPHGSDIFSKTTFKDADASSVRFARHFDGTNCLIKIEN